MRTSSSEFFITGAAAVAERKTNPRGGNSSLGSTGRVERTLSAVEAARTICGSLLWIVVAMLLAWGLINGSITRLLNAIKITHVEGFGIKIDLDQEKQDIISRLSQDVKEQNRSDNYPMNPYFAGIALDRAELNAGAIKGTTVLWVDTNKGSNAAEQHTLGRFGINVIKFQEYRPALEFLKSNPVDLLIINAGSPKRYRPMKRCPLHFYRPLLDKPGLNPVELNQGLVAGFVSPGFAFIEELANAEAKGAQLARFGQLTDVDDPKIIVYSYSQSGVSTNPCTRVITNRVDRLLNTVVSILEESRPVVFPTNLVLDTYTKFNKSADPQSVVAKELSYIP